MRHFEKLVFAAHILDESFGENAGIPDIRDCSPVAGESTCMIHGGDRSTIHEDEFYLKQLCEANTN